MIEVFYKLAFDISYYFMFVSFFLDFVLDYRMDRWMYVVLLCTGFVAAQGLGGRRLGKVISVLALAGSFILWYMVGDKNVYAVFDFLLPWVYMSVVILAERYAVYYVTFRKTWKVALWLCIIPFVVAIAGYEKGFPAMRLSAGYAIAFLVSGILTLQSLRFQSDNRKGFERHQVKQTICFLILCFILTVARIFEGFYEFVIRPIGKFLAYLLAQVMHMITALMGQQEFDIKIDASGEFKSYAEEALERMAVPSDLGDMIAEMTQEAPPPDMTPIIIAGVLIVALIILIVLLGHGKRDFRPSIDDQEREDIPDEDEEEKAKPFFMTPEMTIRKQYCYFMDKTESDKVPVTEWDTTQSIRQKFVVRKPKAAPQSDEITEIYRKARYGHAEMTKEEAGRMKRLVKEV